MERMTTIVDSRVLREFFRWLAAVLFIVAGINHFLHPHFYERIVPPGFPSPQFLVLVSGLAEIAGGLGVLMGRLRRRAGWGLLVLLILIFPANIYMALHPQRFEISPWILWTRLPLQVVLMAWVWWVTLWRSQKSEPLPM